MTVVDSNCKLGLKFLDCKICTLKYFWNYIARRIHFQQSYSFALKKIIETSYINDDITRIGNRGPLLVTA